jgi:protein phosphatase
MRLTLHEPSLVLLIGASASGKSTFAARHFRPTEILSSDAFRALVSDDPTNQAATADAFALLHAVAEKRMARGRVVVVDATNVQDHARKALFELAHRHAYTVTGIVFDLPEWVCQERNRARGDGAYPARVIRRQVDDLRRSRRGLAREGFARLYAFESEGEVDAATVERAPLPVNRADLAGPFDIVGDVHGCFDELVALLEELGWEVLGTGEEATARHPEGRTAVFVGDLVDRGPNSPAVLGLAMNLVRDGVGLCLKGNHDDKLERKLRGRDVQVAHGLAATLEQLDRTPPEFRDAVRDFLAERPSHYVLDGGKLVVAHAGLREELQGRMGRAATPYALYGPTTGETDAAGHPVRLDWAADYRGRALVVYGHTVVAEPTFRNNTINVDTGAVFGGRLSALRYPERELVSVPATRVYDAGEPVGERPYPNSLPRGEGSGGPHPDGRPRGEGSGDPCVDPLAREEARRAPARAADLPGHRGGADGLASVPSRPRDVLLLEDVLGRIAVETRLAGTVTIAPEQASAAFEALNRFAVDPRWLIYLPPTMSPAETSAHPDYLERPEEALAYYERNGVGRLVGEEKHMGSRAVLVVCRDGAVAARRFDVADGRSGVGYTRTGRPLFADRSREAELVARVREALDRAGLWDELATDWVALDAELLPWSAKAQELLRSQYAAVGTSATAAVEAEVGLLEAASGRGIDLAGALERYRDRRQAIGAYVEAYRRYCWEVDGLEGLKLAPFHLLASEGRVHADRDHPWHLGTLARLAEVDPDFFLATAHREVDLADAESRAALVRWWEELTDGGGEGIVLKPRAFVVPGPKGPVQPAIKCRGRAYLRIIYGPEYLAPANLARLRRRSLGRKRSLAAREFALGIESLERFVRHEPLHRVHQAAFAVLALESEPVDPRL